MKLGIINTYPGQFNSSEMYKIAAIKDSSFFSFLYGVAAEITLNIKCDYVIYEV